MLGGSKKTKRKAAILGERKRDTHTHTHTTCHSQPCDFAMFQEPSLPKPGKHALAAGQSHPFHAKATPCTPSPSAKKLCKAFLGPWHPGGPHGPHGPGGPAGPQGGLRLPSLEGRHEASARRFPGGLPVFWGEKMPNAGKKSRVHFC